MAADRRINPHGRLRVADVPLELGELGIELLAHAVEALELERLAVRQRLDLADGVRIVRSEGRVDEIAGGEQLLGAGEVRDVGRDLAGPHRIVGQPADLGQLDLGVPVRTLDQPAHQLAAVGPRRLDHPVTQGRGALLIGLDGDAESGPAPLFAIGAEQRAVGEQRLEHVHLQLEPVGLLGIDGKMDVGRRRLERQLANDRDDRRERFVAVAIFEARVKRGQLDRNARRLPEAALRLLGDPVERTAVGIGISLGVRESLGGLAEHVEAVAQPLALLGLGALQCFVDRPPEHEVAAEDLHRLTHRGAHHRFAQPPDRAAERRLPIIGAVGSSFQYLARQQQRECRGVDERGIGTSKLL